MSLRKFFIIPFLVSALAATLIMLNELLAGFMPPAGNSGFTWIAFMAWALYFVAGCNVGGAVKCFFGYVAGILMGTGVTMFGIKLMPVVGGFMAFPVAVFIVVGLFLFLERTKWFSFLPALFVGAGTFFVFISYVPGATYVNVAITELVYCIIGLFYGWLTIFIRGLYEKFVG